MPFDGFVERAVAHHVEDGREGLAQHRPGVRRQLHQRGAHIERVRRADALDALAAVHRGAGLAAFVQGLLHAVEGGAVDQRTDQRAGLARVAHLHVAVDLHELGHQLVVHALVHEQAPQRGAALAGRAHGREGDAAQREIEVGRGRDDGGVVPAQFEDRAGEARRQLRADLPAHRRGAGGREDRHAGIVDQHLADVARPQQQAEQAFGRVAEAFDGALRDGVHGQRGERRLLGRLPHHRIAAHQRERRVPRPHGHGKVEGRDHAAHAQRMPGFHHPVLGALGGQREAVELAREADREVADVDHFLHLARAFGRNLAGLQRDEAAQVALGGAQLFAQQAHQLAATRRRHQAPGLEGLVRAADGAGGFHGRGLRHLRDHLAADRRAHREVAAGVGGAGHAQAMQQLVDLGGKGHGGLGFWHGRSREKEGQKKKCDSRNGPICAKPAPLPSEKLEGLGAFCE
ncbi:hypothetical protein D9M72_379050 [compost metagenome]